MEFKRLMLVFFVSTLLSSVALANGNSRDADAAWPSAADGDLTKGIAAVQAAKYADGIRLLESYTARVKNNADAENWLGFAYRKTGALDSAFAHYDRALSLDPKHRGAHEYLGEAYLLAGNLPKAQEHLKILEGICGSSCLESGMLRKSIADYQTAHPAGSAAAPTPSTTQ